MRSIVTRLVIVCLCALGVVLPAHAGGSAYSLYGIGDLELSPGGRSMGMGGLFASLWSTSSIFPQNPASWSASKTTKLQGMFGYDNIATHSASDRALYGEGGMRGMAISIPLSVPHGITMAMGFQPLSTVRYALDLGVQPLSDSTTYVAQYTGEGGLSTFFMGSSYAPASWLSVGAAIEYNFGAITRNVDLLFNTSSGYNHTSISTRYSPDGFDGRLAAMFSFENLTAGVSLRTPSVMRTEFRQTYLATTFGARDTAITAAYNQDLPVSYTAGASYRYRDFLFGAEYGAEDWSNVQINGAHPAELRASSTLGIGLERVGNALGTGLDRWSYRAGVRTRTNYVTVNGAAISEWMVTAGAGIPINNQSTVDVALQYGSRGTTDNGNLLENVFRLSGTLTINEMWFQKPD